jgi:hypothetical protein
MEYGAARQSLRVLQFVTSCDIAVVPRAEACWQRIHALPQTSENVEGEVSLAVQSGSAESRPRDTWTSSSRSVLVGAQDHLPRLCGVLAYCLVGFDFEVHVQDHASGVQSYLLVIWMSETIYNLASSRSYNSGSLP